MSEGDSEMVREIVSEGDSEMVREIVSEIVS